MSEHDHPEIPPDDAWTPTPDRSSRVVDDPPRRDERRAAIRMIMVGRTVLTHDTDELAGTVVDLSAGGMRALLADPFTGVIGDEVEVSLPDLDLSLDGVVSGVASVHGMELRVEFAGCTAMQRALLSSAVCQVAVRRRPA